MTKKKIRGIRCDKCKKEVSHIVNHTMPQAEANIVDYELGLAREHRAECDGVVSSFIEEFTK